MNNNKIITSEKSTMYDYNILLNGVTKDTIKKDIKIKKNNIKKNKVKKSKVKESIVKESIFKESIVKESIVKESIVKESIVRENINLYIDSSWIDEIIFISKLLDNLNSIHKKKEQLYYNLCFAKFKIINKVSEIFNLIENIDEFTIISNKVLSILSTFQDYNNIIFFNIINDELMNIMDDYLTITIINLEKILNYKGELKINLSKIDPYIYNNYIDSFNKYYI
jgi:hypothetical protein